MKPRLAGTRFHNNAREFRDVVFEDVVFENDSSVTPFYAKSKDKVKSIIVLSNTTSSNTTSLNPENAIPAAQMDTCRMTYPDHPCS